MAKGTPKNFLHIFEKMSEPLGYGLRGGGGGDSDPMVFFHYKDPSMMNQIMDNTSMMNTIKEMTERMDKAVKAGMKVQMEAVRMPREMPNLETLSILCPRSTNFCYFVPQHQKAFRMLKDMFMKQENADNLFSMACVCRDNTKVNNQMFVYALSSCLVARRDTRGMIIPHHFEIMPANYCSTAVVHQASIMANMHSIKDSSNMKIIIDQNLTTKGTDLEQRLWYFREDILVNSHHFHWHIVFPGCSPKDPKAEGYRDRRGELFYYMHHSMIARYDAERLCNGLPRVKEFDFSNLLLQEGYFSKLSSENSQSQWGTRQANTRLTDVATQAGDTPLGVRVEDLTRWRDRILESIDMGKYVERDEKGAEFRKPLKNMKGIDVLGDIVENNVNLSPHLSLYGTDGFHNMGHVLIAASHDPRGKFRENLGVMGDVSTAMRDPAFYRWHKYIDNLFDIHKSTLPPYPLSSNKVEDLALQWDNIEVVSFDVKAFHSEGRNRLRTFWDYKDVDLSRGLDFRRAMTSDKRTPPVMGRFTHLNHGDFDYILKIKNTTGKQVQATARIFMAPKHDEHGDQFKLSEQRLLFFEMDKVSKTLKPGENEIRVQSKDSSVTLRDDNGSSFKRIEELYRLSTREDILNNSQCSCGWPQHLLLPRGSAGGTEYDLFVIVTNGAIDQIPNVNRKTACNSALSFCGVLNQKYPDSRPMGYPFDRNPYSKNGNMPDDPWSCPQSDTPVNTLKEYVKDIRNSASVTIKIFHERMMQKDSAIMKEQVMSPDGKCMRLGDFYNFPSQENGKMNNNGKWNDSSGRINFNDRNRPSDNYETDQWGGAGEGPRGRRLGGDDEPEWEQL